MPPPMPDNTLIVVPAWRGDVPGQHLLAWLRVVERRGWRWTLGPTHTRPIPCMRNQVVRQFLDEEPWAEYLVQMNANLVPLPSSTIRLLTMPGEVVFCRMPAADGRGDHRCGPLNAGCFRVHRSVYEAMEPPWFAYTYSDDGVQRTGCECDWFVEHLPDDVRPEAVGRVGRPVTRVAVCDDDGPGAHLLVGDNILMGEV